MAEFIGETQESDTLFTDELDLGYESFMRDDENLIELKASLKGINWKSANDDKHAPRRRFDYVIGNPPYIGANECYKQKVLTYELIKQRKVRLNNIYGINLHSIPNHNKKSSPKINLWAMFIALGQGLLKDNGTMSYIIPQGLLTRPSYDVLRYYLSHKMIIEKIFIFANKLFIDRGIKTKKTVTTSSLIFVIKKLPSGLTYDETIALIKNNQVELIRYNIANKDPVECMQEMRTRQNCTIDRIPQTTLKNELRSWNHFFKGKKFLDILEKYSINSEPMAIYYHHDTARARFKSEFWFDIGYDFDHNKLLAENSQDGFLMTSPGVSQVTYTLSDFLGYIPNDITNIKLLQANQGYNLLHSTYKLVWAIKRPNKVLFTDKKIIFRGLATGGIGSNNKLELLYLFILLNSKLTWNLLKIFHKPDNEDKFELLLPPAEIKSLIRVPIITEKNQHLKDRLIVIAQDILDAEKPLFKDCLDLSHLLVQKFISIELDNNEIIFTHGVDSTKTTINKGINIERLQYNLNLYLKAHKKDLSLLAFKTFPCVDNILIDERMKEANTIIYSLYGMNQDDIDIVEK